jgi:O-antigen/teichoic acid export membrane protein
LTNIAINICLYFLISSDRFILALYRDIGEVGVYNQVYNIAQVSFVALLNVYQAVLYPRFVSKLESSDPDENYVISSFAYKTFFLFLPVALLMSFLAKPIFRYAFYLLPYIICGVLFNSMNYFETTKFYFRHKAKLILIGAILAAILNIVLNFIFIPRYGMMAASINTLIAYIFLWCFYYLKSDNKYLSDQRFKNKYALLMLLSIVFVLLFYWVKMNILESISSFFQIFIVSIVLLITYFIFTLRINPFITKKENL